MAKEAVTITIDRHLHQWIKEKGGNKSKVVNSLLHECWIKQRDNPRVWPSPNVKDKHDEHMKKVWLAMGYTEDGSEKLDDEE